MTEPPASLTYYSVVSIDGVYIDVTVADLNDVDILAYDIENGYLNVKSREKIWKNMVPSLEITKGKLL